MRVSLFTARGQQPLLLYVLPVVLVAQKAKRNFRSFMVENCTSFESLLFRAEKQQESNIQHYQAVYLL
jgi:hypothetical protein